MLTFQMHSFIIDLLIDHCLLVFIVVVDVEEASLTFMILGVVTSLFMVKVANQEDTYMMDVIHHMIIVVYMMDVVILIVVTVMVASFIVVAIVGRHHFTTSLQNKLLPQLVQASIPVYYFLLRLFPTYHQPNQHSFWTLYLRNRQLYLADIRDFASVQQQVSIYHLPNSHISLYKHHIYYTNIR